MFDTLLKRSGRVSIERHYYAPSQLFEQSLDIYRPLIDTTTCNVSEQAHVNQSNTSDTTILVLLVVGSGWLGHQFWIYRICSWWNSSGPRTIALALNTPCVYIRHRGTYFYLPLWRDVILCLMLFPIVLFSLVALVWKVDGYHWIAKFTSVSLTIIVASFAILQWSAQGSAHLEDMVHDVAMAVAWVNKNIDLVLSVNNKSTSNMKSRVHKIVLGGYSSGGHVVSVLLARPDVWKIHRLPPPEEIVAAVLMISGVLSVQSSSISSSSTKANKITKCRKANMADASLNNNGAMEMTKLSNDVGCDVLPPKTTVYVTDLIMRIIWGPKWRSEIPSPLTDLNVASIPHLLIQNHDELFGLSWLDTFFCAAEYRRVLQKRSIPVVFRLVNSNHWNVLASRALYDVIKKELPDLLSETTNTLVK